MKRILVPCIILLIAAIAAFGASFTSGNVIVLQTDSNVTTGNTGSLVEYDPTTANQASPVSTLALHSNGSTDDGTSIIFGSSSVLNHDISISADGALIVIPGYANTGTAVDSASATTIPRVVATVRYDKVYARPVTISTTGGGLLSGNAFRGATSDGFGNFWAVSGGGAIAYMTGTTSLSLQAHTGRTIGIANGNLYYTAAPSANPFGIWGFTGLPTTATASSSIISGATTPAGFSIPSGPSVGSKAYLANYNDGNGILSFVWDGSSWVGSNTMVLPGTDRPQHLAVSYSGPQPVLFVTIGALTKLYAITDTGASGTVTPTTLATAASGKFFRGVVLAPTQPALPVFGAQPSSTTNNYGSTVTFGPVDATGANPNAWTWKKGSTTLTDGPTGTGSTISGSTTTSLMISSITSADAGTYYAIAANNGGSISSTGAVLTLAGSTITTQLASRTNAAGTTATFHVVSGGPPPLSYAWYHGLNLLSDGASGNGSTISGSTTDTLSISNVQDGDAGDYTVTVTDNNAVQSSSTATLTVYDFPGITTQPSDTSKAAGTTATFSVDATGGGLHYQWKKGVVALTNGPSGNGSTISGATASTLSIASCQDGDAGSYSVTITNIAGLTNSDPATLTVGHSPQITSPPSTQTNWVGSNVTFTVAATGTSITYSWKHNGTTLVNDGVHIFGADTSSLTIAGIDVTDSRLYTASVNNSFGGDARDAYLFVIMAGPEMDTTPGLVIYEKFNYPVQLYPGFPAPAGWINSWEYIISTYNHVTGQAAYWNRTGNAYCTVESGFLRDPGQSTSGQYPIPGIDCASSNQWYWSSAPNNNHLKFGGISQADGAAYFSCVVHITQGAPLNTGQFDTIAGFTSGDSTNAPNADTWNYKLCTQADNGGDGYYLGVFKGNGSTINGSSGNGEWAYGKHLARGHIHFLVGCYKFVSGTNLIGGSLTNDDIVTLWIDPDRSTFDAAENNLPTPDAGGSQSHWFQNAVISEFGLRGTVPPASKRITDLRIGTTWASVTKPYYPTLHMVKTPTDATLTWPTKDSGYVLQHTNDVSATTWTTIDPPYATDGPNNTVTVGSDSADFFRLYYPPR